MDDDNSKSLNKYEFGKAINDYMLGFTAAESATLFSYFDVDGSGTIDYNDIKGVYNAKNHPEVKAGKKTEE